MVKNGFVKIGEIVVIGFGNFLCKIVIYVVGRILCFIDFVYRKRRYFWVVEMG